MVGGWLLVHGWLNTWLTQHGWLNFRWLVHSLLVRGEPGCRHPVHVNLILHILNSSWIWVRCLDSVLLHMMSPYDLNKVQPNSNVNPPYDLTKFCWYLKFVSPYSGEGRVCYGKLPYPFLDPWKSRNPAFWIPDLDTSSP